MINLNQDKGITLTTLIFAVIIMVIISTVLIYNASTGINTRELNDMYSDIQLLKDKIDLYYINYGSIPIFNVQYTNVSNISNININDSNKYYVIDLEKLDNVRLNYGKGYESYKTDKTDTITDIYVMNERTYTVYYIKGIELDEKMYYTIPGEYTNIDLPSLENVQANVNGDLAQINIKAVNKENGINSINVYVQNQLYKTYTYTEDIYNLRQETLEITSMPFYENKEVYIEVIDSEQNKKASSVITIMNESIINNKEDLTRFAQVVNSGNNFENKTVKLTQDIDLQGNTSNIWTPIANYADNNANIFLGTFDGQNHKISNLYIDTNKDYQGLFGYNKGIINNLKIDNALIKSTGKYIGGVVGYNIGTCESIIVSGTISGSTNIGGITGKSINGIIKKCASLGSVAGKQCVGGIVGSATKSIIQESYNNAQVIGNSYTFTVSDGNVGGIVGTTFNSVVQYCYNTGKIQSTASWTGGIVGGHTRGSKIIGCYNAGAVYGGKYVSGSTKNAFMGGIAANTFYNSPDSKNNCEILYCYNIGEVINEIGGIEEYLGGVMGYIQNGYVTMTECYDKGIITGMTNATKKYRGSIVGLIGVSGSNVNVSKAYYTSTTIPGIGIDNGTASTNHKVETTKLIENQMPSIISIVGQDYYKEDVNNINNGYPVLKWQI